MSIRDAPNRRKFDHSEVFIAFRYKDIARRVLGLNINDI